MTERPERTLRTISSSTSSPKPAFFGELKKKLMSEKDKAYLAILENATKVNNYFLTLTATPSKEMLDLYQSYCFEFTKLHPTQYYFAGTETPVFLLLVENDAEWQEDTLKYATLDRIVDIITDPNTKGIPLLFLIFRRYDGRRNVDDL
jgi:hypothetical protein